MYPFPPIRDRSRATRSGVSVGRTADSLPPSLNTFVLPARPHHPYWVTADVAPRATHRNVATLADTPKGQTGRPSNSLTLEQASALLAATAGTRMHAYISLCLATGIRTEEARELRWDHVDFGDPAARPPVPARAAGVEWSEHGLVFATRTGGALDAANVRREFTAACRAAKVGQDWTPRELRHSFVSPMSSSGVPVEEIARLAGHSNTRTTEVVYRRELRPVLTTGAEAMDRLFRPTETRWS